MTNAELAEAYRALGKLALEQSDRAGAISNLAKALQLNPDLEPVYFDLCLALLQSGHPAEARAIIEEGQARFPANVNFDYYLGNLALKAAAYDDAISRFARVLAVQPDYPEVLSNMGLALKHQGQPDAALACFRQSLALDPGIVETHSNMLLTMLYCPSQAPAEIYAEHLRFADRFEAPLRAGWPAHDNLRDPDKRLKIGYLSADFCRHTAANLIEPVLVNHDKAAFEVFCYYNNTLEDDMTRRFIVLADHWLPCLDDSDQQLAQRIRDDGIDILVDLSGHTAGNRLLAMARKPAPIQATWMGYQSTTGLSAIDYRISDDATDPPGMTERYHSETLVRLPAQGQFTPDVDSPPVNALPALDAGYVTFGCLNNLAKINQDSVHLWARILNAVPGSRMMLGNASEPASRHRMLAMFAEEGVPAERLILEPKMALHQYLALHHRIDLALDTFPYNGGTTTFHALWMGVPVIALGGDTPVSRAGMTIMAKAGYPELVADSVDDYVALTVELARDLPRLSAIRQGLRARAGKLFDNDPAYLTRPLEQLYRQLWRAWCHADA